MSDNYHYEDGAKHYDHKKVLHIDSVGSGDIEKLISAFFKDGAEDAEVLEEFEDAESVQRQDKELKNNPHKVNPVEDAVKEQTDQDNPPSPLNSISPFTSAVIDTTKVEAVIALLRQLMEGKTKPKDVLMPVRAAMDAGVIRRPTWEEFCQEFGSYRLKSKTSFSDYTNPDKSPYTGADFGMMKEKFRQLMSEGQ
jgi:hypothetical protein